MALTTSSSSPHLGNVLHACFHFSIFVTDQLLIGFGIEYSCYQPDFLEDRVRLVSLSICFDFLSDQRNVRVLVSPWKLVDAFGEAFPRFLLFASFRSPFYRRYGLFCEPVSPFFREFSRVPRYVYVLYVLAMSSIAVRRYSYVMKLGGWDLLAASYLERLRATGFEFCIFCDVLFFLSICSWSLNSIISSLLWSDPHFASSSVFAFLHDDLYFLFISNFKKKIFQFWS